MGVSMGWNLPVVGAWTRVGWCIMPCVPGKGVQVVAGRGVSIDERLCDWME